MKALRAQGQVQLGENGKASESPIFHRAGPLPCAIFLGGIFFLVTCASAHGHDAWPAWHCPSEGNKFPNIPVVSSGTVGLFENIWNQCVYIIYIYMDAMRIYGFNMVSIWFQYPRTPISYHFQWMIIIFSMECSTSHQ